MPGTSLDATTGPDLVRRVRRRADLSQRELAERLGVPQASVARWETGRASLPFATVERLAALAGLRIALVDEAGETVPAMRRDAARDRAGRRYPAHVDPRAEGWWSPRGSHLTVEGITARRRSREDGVPQVNYQRGMWRAVLRRLLGTPDDHPTASQLLADVQARTGETSVGGAAPSD